MQTNIHSPSASRHVGKAKIIPPDCLFLPFQKAWINDKSRLKLAVKSRQIGWSWATAYSLVIRKATKGARHDAWISSRDESLARLFIRDCRAFAESLNIAGADLGEPIIDRHGNSTFAIELSNRLRIHATSSSPDAQAGKRGDRILDEFALHRNPELLYTVAYPGITWGGSLEIISTPRGTRNFFNTLVSEVLDGGNPKNFSFHRVTLEDALAQGLLYKLQQKAPEHDPIQQMDEADYFNHIKSGCSEEQYFLQEYMCSPADDSSAFLSYDLITPCEYPSNENWQHTLPQLAALGNPLFVGVDIGRTHDLTIIWVLEKNNEILYTRKIITLKNETFDLQERTLYDLLRVSNIQRCCIDQTGIGRQFAERARQKFYHRIEVVQFTADTKETLVYPLRTAFENQTIRIPNDPIIRSDLRSLRKEHTSSGNIRFTADSGASGHADRFWALALAFHAASKPQSRAGAFVA